MKPLHFRITCVFLEPNVGEQMRARNAGFTGREIGAKQFWINAGADVRLHSVDKIRQWDIRAVRRLNLAAVNDALYRQIDARRSACCLSHGQRFSFELLETRRDDRLFVRRRSAARKLSIEVERIALQSAQLLAVTRGPLIGGSVKVRFQLLKCGIRGRNRLLAGVALGRDARINQHVAH
jgi:hypothetical protein